MTEKDVLLYQQIGLIDMLERNAGVKERPEKFQSCSEQFDIIFACESTVFEKIIQGNLFMAINKILLIPFFLFLLSRYSILMIVFRFQ